MVCLPGEWREFVNGGLPCHTALMNRPLVTLGALLVVAGLLWRWLKKLPMFHLPGDIVVDRPGFKLFFPITTMLIVSAILSIIAWLMRR